MTGRREHKRATRELWPILSCWAGRLRSRATRLGGVGGGDSMRKSYLVCCDVCDDKRLRKVFSIMRGYGHHLQYSGFECQFAMPDLARWPADLNAVIHHDDDRVLFIHLGPPEGRGDRVITALPLPYTNADAPCLVVYWRP